MITRIGLSAAALLVFFMALRPVYALTDPSSVTISGVDAYRSTVEVDDLLVIVRYNIAYATPPSVGTGNSFLVRLMNSGGTPQIAVNTPYPFNDNGYNQGLASVYMTAAQVAAAGLTWQDPLVLRVEGNPAFYVSPLVASQTLAAGDYATPADGGGIPPCDDTGSCQANNRAQLASRVLAVASELQGYWGGSALIESSAVGSRLSSTGELYFGLAIPGLVVMAPGAYAVITVDPDVAAKTYTNTGQTNAESRYAATAWLTAFDTLNTNWGLPSKTIQSLIFMALVIAMMLISKVEFGRIEPGFGFALLALPVFWYMGWVPFQLAALILFAVGAMGVVMIMRGLFRGVA